MKTSRRVREFAKAMRQEPARSEERIWSWLRDRRCGYKFRRQYPCGPSILDFYCAELRLAIELDGRQHREPHTVNYENQRTNFLEARGIEIVRIANEELIRDSFSVEEVITAAIQKLASTT